MTDRVRTLTVILDHEYREDALEPLMGAIRMLLCVEEVKLGPVTDLGNEYAYGVQLKAELRRKLMKVLE